MPSSYWPDALLTATYLINRFPSPVLNFKSPYELLFHVIPSYSHLRVFGCCCYPWLQPYWTSKLTPKSKCCVFLGYASSSKGYKCLDLETGTVHISRHVQFVEHQFPFSPIFCQYIHPSPLPPLLQSSSSASSHSSLSSPNPPISPLPTFVPLSFSSSSSSVLAPNPPPSTPSFHFSLHSSFSPPAVSSLPIPSSSPSPSNTHIMITRAKAGISKAKLPFDPSTHLTISAPTSDSLLHHKPTTFSQAHKSPVWRGAMSEEFNALLTQQTWSLVPLPPHKSVFGCK